MFDAFSTEIKQNNNSADLRLVSDLPSLRFGKGGDGDVLCQDDRLLRYLAVKCVVPREKLRHQKPTQQHDDVLPAHCLFPTVGFSVSGPFDHTKYCNSLLPFSPMNLSAYELPGVRPENARVLGREGLVAEQHLPGLHLKAGVVGSR